MERITKKEFIEYITENDAGVTVDEFSDIDIEDFILNFWLTPQYMDRDLAYLLEWYKKDIEKHNVYLAAKNYNYLLDAEYAPLKEEDIPNITRLYCEFFYGDADWGMYGVWQAYVFDFEEKIFDYSWGRPILSMDGRYEYGIYITDKACTLPADAFEDITGLLLEHNVIKTRQKAKGTYDLYLEFKDGRIIRHACNSNFTKALYRYEMDNFSKSAYK